MSHLQRLCDWVLPGLAPCDPFLFGPITQPLDVSLPLQENRAVTACDELRCPLCPRWKALVSTQQFGWDCSHLKEGVVLFADKRMAMWSFSCSSNVEFQRFSNLHICSIHPILNTSSTPSLSASSSLPWRRIWETMEGHCLLTCSPGLAQSAFFYYPAQEWHHPTVSGSTHRNH